MNYPDLMPRKKTSTKLAPKKAKAQTRTQAVGKLPRYRQASLFVAAAAIALLGFYLFSSRAAVSPVVGGSSTCGARVANYSYARPFGQNAAWNIPACALPKWSRSADWVSRLYNNGYVYQMLGNKTVKGVSQPLSRLDFTTELGLLDAQSTNNDYAVPIYNASEATQQVRIRLKTDFIGYNANIGGDWIGSPTYNWNATVPWNPAWQPASGNDGGLVVIDKATGHEWYLWNVSRTDMAAPHNNVSSCVLGDAADRLQNILTPSKIRGYDQNVDLCVAAAVITKDSKGNLADFRTYEGNSPSSSGSGIQNYALTVMPDEVAAGEIRHALKFMIPNSMFGPECPKTMSVNDPAFGSTCGSAIAPAGQFERVGDTGGGQLGFNYGPGTTPDARRLGSIPEGTRFALNISDAEIQTWLDSVGYTGRKRETARIFAVALRDYGMMVTDTSGSAAFFQAADGVNPVTAKQWRDLGIDNNGKDLLFGLLTKDKLYTPEPPTNLCGDGTRTQWYCHANGSQYANLSTAQPPASTVSPTTPVATTVTSAPTTPACVASYKQPCPTPTTLTGPDTTPPTAPTELKRDVRWDPIAFKYFMTLNWKPATDNVGVTGYVITRNNLPLTTVTKNEYADYSFAANTPVTYQFQAKDAAGNLSSAASIIAQGKCWLIWCWAE